MFEFYLFFWLSFFCCVRVGTLALVFWSLYGFLRMVTGRLVWRDKIIYDCYIVYVEVVVAFGTFSFSFRFFYFGRLDKLAEFLGINFKVVFFFLRYGVTRSLSGRIGCFWGFIYRVFGIWGRYYCGSVCWLLLVKVSFGLWYRSCGVGTVFGFVVVLFFNSYFSFVR